MSWTLTTCGLTCQPGPCSLVTAESLSGQVPDPGYPLQADPASRPQRSLRPASAAQHTWMGLPSAAPACPPPSVGVVGRALPGETLSALLAQTGTPLAPAPIAPWLGDGYGEGRARVFPQMRRAVPRGGSSKVHPENVQLGLSTTFSIRRVVSTRAGCQERLKNFMPGAFQNLTRL